MKKMSVLRILEDGSSFFLCHRTFLNLTYGPKYRTKDLFEIKTPFRMDAEATSLANRLLQGEAMEPPRKKKKKTNSDAEEDPFKAEKHVLKDTLETLNKISELFEAPQSIEVIRLNNSKVRKLVKELENDHELEDELPGATAHVREGGNKQMFTVLEEQVLLPPRSSFLQGNVRTCLSSMVKQSQLFDVILMDPPWENKHVKRELKRNRGYEMLGNEDIGNLLIPKILSEQGLVLVWCTPSQRHLNAVSEWMTKWGCHYVEKILWMKVTRSGEPVVDLAKKHKQTFEVLFVGSKVDLLVARGSRSPGLVMPKVITSVPSAVQSHKPPLSDFLLKAFDLKVANTRNLEIFGRYLLPHWTTVGSQCTKFQELKYFHPYGKLEMAKKE